MATLLDQTTINGMTLQNRLVRSATWEGMCEQSGKPAEKVVNWYRDLAQGGIGLIITGYAAKKLSGAGIDAIEISTGTPASGEKGPARGKINKPEREAYNLDPARKVKAAVGCPVMVVGGFRSYEVAENAIRDDGMDYISMARPLIREPGLPNRWIKGDRRPARCISCNKCFMAGLEEGGIYCVIEKKEREKAAKR